MKIGIFDSGVGGLSVANVLEAKFPEHEIVFRNDAEHVPYGTREPEELLSFVDPIFRQMIAEGCELIVVACNTISTTIIERLRQHCNVPLVAIEPMVKPAASQTETGVIAICATPTTLKSARYRQLKSKYAKGIKVIEPDCSDWAGMIEHNMTSELHIDHRIRQLLNQKVDVIVLACTHYHWIEQEILETAGSDAKVLQPEQAIVAQVATVISRR